MVEKIAVFWFRRDLRLHDNTCLFRALTSGMRVLPIFIFDTSILDKLNKPFDRRVEFIYNTIEQLKKQITKHGSNLQVHLGKPKEVIENICQTYKVTAVYANSDYEPYATQRDLEIQHMLAQKQIGFVTCKDHVIFEKSEIVKANGTPYSVFTPYSKKWKVAYTEKKQTFYPSQEYLHRLVKIAEATRKINLSEIGFQETNFEAPREEIDTLKLTHYHNTRDFMAKNATSKLSIHLRFGTISIREVVAKAVAVNQTWLNELIWREFYSSILWHFPQVVSSSFKPKYDTITWRNNENEFEAWCTGNTGYPIVDAGMRELLQTGFMHNRARMITASFLTKHLLIDWRWGEAFFAQHLIDYELASNNGSWQWAASCGCDAVPYFRIFNPWLQTKKFDPNKEYIQKWVPEWQSSIYPTPIVEHSFARKRALAVFEKSVKNVDLLLS